MKKLFIIACFIAVLSYRKAFAQDVAAGNPSLVTETESGVLTNLTPIPQGEIKTVVSSIMADVVRGDTSQVSGLALRSAEALPYLPPFINHPNDEVRKAVAQVASYSQTQKAVEILTELVHGKDGSRQEATERLFVVYTSDQIRSWGKNRLATGLMQYIEKEPRSAEGTLLLSCFRGNAKVIEFLRKDRARHSLLNLMITRPEESPIVKLGVCADIALAELGDVEASKRFGGYLRGNDMKNIRFILHAVKFVNIKDSLLKISELLKDNRAAFVLALIVCPGPVEVTKDDKSPIHIARVSTVTLRVSDLAFQALRFKVGISKNYKMYRFSRTPDKELLKAYGQVKATILKNYTD